MVVTGYSNLHSLESDFTIEFWFRPHVTPSGESYLMGWGGAAYLTFDNTRKVALVSGGSLTSTSALALDTWAHIAISREGRTTKLFIDGVQQASATNISNMGSGASQITVGSYADGGSATINGNIDEVRIVNGAALYTGTFTVPGQAPGY